MTTEKKIDWNKKNKENAEEAAKVLTKAVNNMCFDMKAFVETIMREHRTLQQNVFEAMLHLCEAWAALPENRYDLRNQYTVEISRKIMEIVVSPKTPFI